MPDEPTPQTDERQRHGRRLEELVRDRWTDARGIRGLSQELGISRATLYSWFNGATSPDTASLTRLARLLLVSPSEVLAALEGTDQTAQLDERIRAVAHQTVAEYVSPITDEQARMSARAPDAWRLAASGPTLSVPPPATSARLAFPRMTKQRMWVTPGPRVLDLLGPQTVEWCDADDPIGPVARRLYAGSYSQMPVRDRETWIALLTTDTIARWTAARSGRGLGYDEATPVREVLPYTEDPENFMVVPADAPAEVVLRIFDGFEAQGRSLAAVLVTRTGDARGEIVGIVTVSDVTQLRR